METASYSFIQNVVEETSVPKGGILSRTIFSGHGMKIVAFAFDTDQELSEHTAAKPAIVQILSGSGILKMGSEETMVQAGSVAVMAANLPHSLKAHEPLKMFLTLLPNELVE